MHDEAAGTHSTDWPQILGLYDLLVRLEPNPMTMLNRAVAVGQVHGPAAALDALAALQPDRRLSSHHRFYATRAHLLEQAGDPVAAAADYRAAARRATSLPERQYLAAQARRLAAEMG